MDGDVAAKAQPVMRKSAIQDIGGNDKQEQTPVSPESTSHYQPEGPNSNGVVTVDGGNPGFNQSPTKKKKRSKRPASKRGIGKPTGMEEFYADAPLTPEEFAEQRQIYDLAIPFIEYDPRDLNRDTSDAIHSRLTTAIQKFERTRKLSPERRNVFYKWLQYGSVDTGPNMFVGGVDQENMDKDQIAAALSQVKIRDEIKAEIEQRGTQSEKYVVDFEGCMKGFLSYRAHNIWSFDNKEQINLVTTTIERFMDYLLQHDVCPEYYEDILRTRDLCRIASSELWACSQAQRWLPGDFNIACSTLFGGDYGKTYDGETYWGPDDKDESVFVGFTAEKATQIVGFAIAGAASEDIYRNYHDIVQSDANKTLEVVRTIEDHGFEITCMERPSTECKELYKTESENFRPVGRVFAKPWRNPEAAPEDFAPAENGKIVNAEDMIHQDEYVFFLEDASLQYVSVGQKIQAKISQLNCGVWIFDQFVRVLPSFEIYLLNEMTVGYKEPKMLNDVPESYSHEDVCIKATQSVNNDNTALEDGEVPNALGKDESY